MDGLSIYVKYSFGNMGFAKSICGKSPIQYAEKDDSTVPYTSIFFQCEKSTTIQTVIDSGLMLDKKYGGEDKILRQCERQDTY